MVRKTGKVFFAAVFGVTLFIATIFTGEARANGPTKYPIVLVHGLSGWSNVAGIEYFWGIKEYLNSLGYQVYEPQLDAFNTIQVLGTELANQINQILAATGAQKVNIIAHSMGGLDARYAITKLGMGNKVATLTMIGTPNQGSSVADVALGLIPGSMQDVLNGFLWFAGCSIDQQNYTTCTQNAIAAISNLTTTYVRNVFNPATPNNPAVKYFSYAGETNPWQVNPLLSLSYWILLFNEGSNDGLVSVNSAKWGTYEGLVYTDHFGEIGQLFGAPAEGFNQYSFYGSVAQHLKNMGY